MAINGFLLGLAGFFAGSAPTPIPDVNQSLRYQEATLESIDRQSMPLLARTNMFRLEKAKTSPKHQWQFEWMSVGFGATGNRDVMQRRFQVFSQIRKQEKDLSHDVCRMLLRLWDMSYSRLGEDHLPVYGETVDVYLCFEGEPGGEQLSDKDPELNNRQVNTIYIYQVSGFTDPLEKAREIAHEYGHAVLPALGIYSAPEQFANGDLGERLFMSWLLSAQLSKKLEPADMMGATTEMLQGYVDTKVKPLIEDFAVNGPEKAALTSRDQNGYNAVLGASLWAASLLPATQFMHALKLGSNNIDKIDEAIFDAASASGINFTVPTYLKGKAIWLPVGKGKLGGAKALRTAGNWTKVQPTADKVTVTFS